MFKTYDRFILTKRHDICFSFGDAIFFFSKFAKMVVEESKWNKKIPILCIFSILGSLNASFRICVLPFLMCIIKGVLKTADKVMDYGIHFVAWSSVLDLCDYVNAYVITLGNVWWVYYLDYIIHYIINCCTKLANAIHWLHNQN